jgi:hypothetical protein
LIIEAHDRVEPIVHNGNPPHGAGEDFRKFFDASIDPFLAVVRAFGFSEQEGAADAACRAVIPARDGHVDEV